MSQKKKTTNTLDRTLRPKSLNEFLGQEKVKDKLKTFLKAAKKRKEPLEHILFYGPPGLGKTTLSHVIANEMGGDIRVTSGPAIERAGDLASILTNLKDKDILFIDEVHRLSKVVEETLYPAMEEFSLDIVLGKGPSARTLRLELPQFTIIGATTRIGLISSPMRDRFGVIQRIDFYSQPEIKEILQRTAKMLEIELHKEAARELAKTSRGTPRVANRLLRRVRDYAQVHGEGEMNLKIIKKALELLEVDKAGLDKTDRKILKSIIKKHSGGPVGIETIAATISEDVETLIDVHEPFLLQVGFVKRTPRGRIATPAAYEHLKIKIPSKNKQQQSLL
jgi:Holliday junction DNA helicase RuvB